MSDLRKKLMDTPIHKLRNEARKFGVERYSVMTKEELIDEMFKIAKGQDNVNDKQLEDCLHDYFSNLEFFVPEPNESELEFLKRECERNKKDYDIVSDKYLLYDVIHSIELHITPIKLSEQQKRFIQNKLKNQPNIKKVRKIKNDIIKYLDKAFY